MNKLTKIFLILLALLVSIFLIYLFVNTNAKHTVLRVVDGDTVYIDFNNNGIAEKNEKKGLSDIVAFETRPGYRLNRQMKDYDLTEQEVSGLGNLARELLEKKVLNRKVKVKFINKKKYYALLYLDGEPVQDSLIESGYVVPYKRSRRYHYDEELIQKARKQLKGRDLKAKPYEQETQAHEEKVSEKQIPDVHTEFIDLYFIDPTKYDKPAKYCRTSACQALLREINNAKQSIDFAIYGISRQPEIFNALIAAQKRGVKVHWVADYNEKCFNIYKDTEELAKLLPDMRLDGFITDLDMPYKQVIKYEIYGQEVTAKFSDKEITEFNELVMHNKFFIFDKSKVWTGSTNISSTGTGGYNSNVGILIKSKTIANLYLQEFDQMYEKGNFHKLKHKILNRKNINLNDGSNISIYFSPDSEVMREGLIPLINNAKKYVYIPIFFFTDKYLPQSLINAYERGVDVRMIIDASSAERKYTKHRILKMAGIPVKVENFGGKMHMKSVIIDDEYLFMGSMNFTSRGQYYNDENMLVVKNPALATGYRSFFMKLWKDIPDKWLVNEPKAEGWDSTNSCTDGIDNDHDGYKDKIDYSCR